MKDFANRDWAINVKRSNEHGNWTAFGIVMLLMVVGSSNIIELLL